MGSFVPTNALRSVPLRVPPATAPYPSLDAGRQFNRGKLILETNVGEKENVPSTQPPLAEYKDKNRVHQKIHHSSLDASQTSGPRPNLGFGSAINEIRDPSVLMNARKWAMLGVPVESQYTDSFLAPAPTHAYTTSSRGSSTCASHSIHHKQELEESRREKETLSMCRSVCTTSGKMKWFNEGNEERGRGGTDILTIISPSCARLLPSHASCGIHTNSDKGCHPILRIKDKKEEQECSINHFSHSHYHNSGGKNKSSETCGEREGTEASNASHRVRTNPPELDWQHEFSFMYDTPTLLDGEEEEAGGCTSFPVSSSSLKTAFEGLNEVNAQVLHPSSLSLPSEREESLHSLSESSLVPVVASTSPSYELGNGANSMPPVMLGASAAALQQITQLWKQSKGIKACASSKLKITSPRSSSNCSSGSSAGFAFFRKMKYSTRKTSTVKKVAQLSDRRNTKKKKQQKENAERTDPALLETEAEKPLWQINMEGWGEDNHSVSEVEQEECTDATASCEILHKEKNFADNLLGKVKRKRVGQEKKQQARRQASPLFRSQLKNGKRFLRPLEASSFSGSVNGNSLDVLPSYKNIAASSAATIPQEVLTSSQGVEELWNSLHRALLDPDRIQSPPLFAGVLLRCGSELSSNFTEQIPEKDVPHLREQKRVLLSQEGKKWLSLVHEFAFRWQDKVYRMDPTLGVPFMLRVLRELRGVEVITFNAPLLLTPLLVATGGSLHTTCISDVRVMAWMCACFPSTVVSQYPFLRQAVLETGMANPHPGGPIDVRGLSSHLCRLSGPCVAVNVSNRTSHQGPTSMLGSHDSTGSITHAEGMFSSSFVFPFGTHGAVQGLVDDVFSLAPLYRHLYGHMGLKGLLQPFLRQEKRISLLLAQMKYNGILVDMAVVSRLRSQFLSEMETARNRAQEILSPFYPMGDFNIQSSDQCRQALYEHLQLGRYLGRFESSDPHPTSVPSLSSSSTNLHVSGVNPNAAITKGGKVSTAEETLRLLTPHHELPRVIIQYRKAAKIIQTYIEGITQNAVMQKSPLSNGLSALPVSISSRTPVEQKVGDPFSLIPHEEKFEQVEKDPGCVSDTASFNARNDPISIMRLPPELSVTFPLATPTEGRTGDDCPEESVNAVHVGKAMMHPNFIHEGTETGRLSCVEPNLQNLPRGGGRGENTNSSSNVNQSSHNSGGGLGGGHVMERIQRHSVLMDRTEEEEENLRELRLCFVAPEGHVLVSIDFEQIELRVLAHLSGDAALIEALSNPPPAPLSNISFVFCAGNNPRASTSPQYTDIHTRIAEKVYQKKVVSLEERNLAKRIVFGTLYGAGAASLSSQLDIPIETVRHVICGIQKSFPSLNTYREKILEEARSNGLVRTLSGRIRYLPELKSGVATQRSHAERQAFNTVVQGSAADVMKLAMLNVQQKMLSIDPSHGPARLLLQIHDELIFCLPSKDLLVMIPALMEAMMSAVSLRVSLPVVAKYGPSLGSLHPWTVENELGLCSPFTSL